MFRFLDAIEQLATGHKHLSRLMMGLSIALISFVAIGIAVAVIMLVALILTAVFPFNITLTIFGVIVILYAIGFLMDD